MCVHVHFKGCRSAGYHRGGGLNQRVMCIMVVHSIKTKQPNGENFDLNIPTWGPGSVRTPAVEELSPSWTFSSSSLMTVNIMYGVCVCVVCV